jgi:DNA-binding NarL/FixJ family response regulator
MNGRYRFLLADRRAITRQLMVAYLEGLPYAGCVDAASGNIDALRALESRTYDVVIARTEASGLDGLSVAAEVRRRKLPTKVVLIGHSSATEWELQRALNAGVLAYLAPEDGLAELAWALESVLRNQIYVPQSLLRDRSLADLIHETRGLPQSPFDRFSTREREVLQCICEGMSSPLISALLGISLHTVEGHRTALMNKTASHSTVDLLRWLQAVEQFWAERGSSGQPGGMLGMALPAEA